MQIDILDDKLFAKIQTCNELLKTVTDKKVGLRLQHKKDTFEEVMKDIREIKRKFG